MVGELGIRLCWLELELAELGIEIERTREKG